MVDTRDFVRAARRGFNNAWHVGLARHLGVEPSVIADMEAGRRPISDEAVAAVADKLRETIGQASERLEALLAGVR